jgi:class 3 adenylate cyclase
MVGFTAWSSEREPEEVFVLLEAIYERFDLIANQLGVFKVETIGDCYMAAVGLPKPNRHHAVVAAQFAIECLHVMKEVTTNLEAQLGPGTASIGLRIGLHSGTVTGGVLRGERSRFQLFGDTVNTASRMESNGVPGRVQVSQATADLLMASGKQHWLIPRKDMIQAKGKGRMQVYFVERRRKLRGNVSGYVGTNTKNSNEWDAVSESESLNCFTPNTSSCVTRDERLIEWNAELLLASLLSRRHAQNFFSLKVGHGLQNNLETVRSELRGFIAHLATLFPDRLYHNFEHASISAMFANTLMKQALQNLKLAPDGSKRHDPSMAIAHFATVLAVLLHDIRYPSDGRRPCLLPSMMALLSSDKYEALASALFHAPDDDNTFISVFSTCIHGFPVYNAEGDENSLCACCLEAQTHDSDNEAILPHGMIDVVKLIIKSSEIAHWFQHWNTFSVWHGMYFAEIQSDFMNGLSSDQDPSLVWHEYELHFFKHRVQPLAAEFKACGFGNDYIARAEENYNEWQVSGHKATQKLTMDEARKKNSKQHEARQSGSQPAY